MGAFWWRSREPVSSTPHQSCSSRTSSMRTSQPGASEDWSTSLPIRTFATNGYIYLFYTAASPQRDRVSRFTMIGNTANPASELVVWQGRGRFHQHRSPRRRSRLRTRTESSTFPLATTAIRRPSQSLTSDHGKILRVNKDGTIPDGQSVLRRQRTEHRCDLGTWSAEPVSVLVRPGQWPHVHRRCRRRTRSRKSTSVSPAPTTVGRPARVHAAMAGMTNPIFSYPHDGRDAAITGGFVYRGTQFPAELSGRLFLRRLRAELDPVPDARTRPAT